MEITRVFLALALSLALAGSPLTAQAEPEPTDEAATDGEPVWLGQPIWIEQRDIALEEALLRLFGDSGLGLIVGPQAHGRRVDLVAAGEPYDRVWSRLLKEAGLLSAFTGNVVVVSPERAWNTDFQRCDLRSVALSLRVGVDAREVESALLELVGDGGKVDVRSVEGVLLLTAPIPRLKEAEGWLEEHEALDPDGETTDAQARALEALVESEQAAWEATRSREAEESKLRAEDAQARALPIRRGVPAPAPRKAPVRLLAPPAVARDAAVASRPEAEPADEPGRVVVTVALDEPSSPLCEFIAWPDEPFELRRVTALALLDQLPAATCSVDAVPESLAALRETLVTVSLPAATFEGLMGAIALASGQWSELDAAARTVRLVSEKP